MTAIESNDREQIEAWLGRRLTDSELQPVESLQALTDEQLAVVAAIRPRNLIAPLLFVRAVVPTASTSEIRELIDDLGAFIALRRRPDLANLALFEHHVGRPLSAAEKAPAATLGEVSPAHLAIAATLARQAQTVAFLYLRRIVPSATTEACSAVVKQLAAGSSA